MRKSESSLQAS